MSVVPQTKEEAKAASTTEIKRIGVETSVFLRFSPKARRLDLSLPHRPTGAITDSAPKVRRERYPSNTAS